jgi:N-acetylglucosaminyldiphosphoundecaprenol N-acetyl-beta-D-mannosaminyltransferase
MNSGKQRQRIRIGQIWIDRLTFSEALDEIEHLVDAGRGGAVFTPNVDHVVHAETIPDLRAAYAAASLSLVDGQPLLWASRLLGTPLPERISGSDLVQPLVERAAKRRWGVYLLGGGPGVAEAAAVEFQMRHGARMVGIDAPSISMVPGPEDGAAIERICSARPQIALVGLGAPKQELWIDRVRDQLRPTVFVAIGGALNFVTGSVRRAPKWMSNAGLEWLFRLSQEPRLAQRYLLRDPKFLSIFLQTGLLPRGERQTFLE